MNFFASTYVHALEGRLRIKLPKIKSAPGEALEVERYLRQLAGVNSVSANPTTGNALIFYNPGIIDEKEVFFALLQSGYLPQPMAVVERTDSPSTAERLANAMASTIMEIVLGGLVGALL